MATPGFTAEYGLYRSSRTYQGGGFDGGDHLNEMVGPAGAMCNPTAYAQCIAHNFQQLDPSLLLIVCQKQYGCVSGSSCVGEGANRHCVPPAEGTCGGLGCPYGNACCEGTCCSPGDSCCAGSCCTPGRICCGETCCPHGQVCCNGACCTPESCCHNACKNLARDHHNCGSCGHVCQQGTVCCNGTCCNDASCCQNTGLCCPTGQSCCNGTCLPAGYTCCNGNSIPPTSQLKSWSQYFLYSPGCQSIEGLTLTFDAAQNPMISTTGFSVQLNAFQQDTVGSFLQFIFFVANGPITANIQDHTTSPPGGSSPYASFQSDSQYLSIELTYDNDGEAVNGAIFSVCDSDGNSCESYPLAVPSPFHHPINAFQVNIVYDPGSGGTLGAYAKFTQGSGAITYQVSNGQQLCNLGKNPDQCAINWSPTAEESNIVYGSISSSTGTCCGQVLTQKFTS